MSFKCSSVKVKVQLRLFCHAFLNSFVLLTILMFSLFYHAEPQQKQALYPRRSLMSHLSQVWTAIIHFIHFLHSMTEIRLLQHNHFHLKLNTKSTVSLRLQCFEIITLGCCSSIWRWMKWLLKSRSEEVQIPWWNMSCIQKRFYYFIVQTKPSAQCTFPLGS